MTDDGSAAPGRRQKRRRRPAPSPTFEAAEAAAAEEAAANLARPEEPASTVTTEPPPDVPEPSGPPEPWLPVMDGRSPNASVCPFLRAVGPDDLVGGPVETPDVANRCAALHDPVPQSLRQQELVCLTSGHHNCPRYLRGAVGVGDVAAASVRPGRALRPATTLTFPSISPAIVGSIALLALALVISVSFVLARGDLALTAAVLPSPTPDLVAAVPTASPTGEAAASLPVAPSASPTSAPASTPTPSPVPSSTASPTPTPSPSPTPDPTAEPTAEPTPKPEPTSARYALLDPCPDTPKCWIYTVRRGDNLFSIANYFGVSMQAIYDRNPWAENGRLKAGLQLRLPPPTR